MRFLLLENCDSYFDSEHTHTYTHTQTHTRKETCDWNPDTLALKWGLFHPLSHFPFTPRLSLPHFVSLSIYIYIYLSIHPSIYLSISIYHWAHFHSPMFSHLPHSIPVSALPSPPYHHNIHIFTSNCVVKLQSPSLKSGLISSWLSSEAYSCCVWLCYRVFYNRCSERLL